MGMGSRVLTQWMAFELIEASDSNPEVTEWDTLETAKQKAAAKARTGAKWQQN